MRGKTGKKRRNTERFPFTRGFVATTCNDTRVGFAWLHGCCGCALPLLHLAAAFYLVETRIFFCNREGEWIRYKRRCKRAGISQVLTNATFETLNALFIIDCRVWKSQFQILLMFITPSSKNKLNVKQPRKKPRIISFVKLNQNGFI